MTTLEKRAETCSEQQTKGQHYFNLQEERSRNVQSKFDILPCLLPTAECTTVQEDPERKIILLKHLLGRDLKAADLKWSFFVAACHSYRVDSCLKPFPPMYITNECKDVEALRKAIEIIPPLTVIFQHLHEPNAYENNKTAIELLYWVLIRLRDPHIKSISKECYGSILRKVQSEMSVAAPNLIFQVESAKQSPSEESWKATAQGHGTFYAYHGSRLENFYSIIHYGLQQNMCKTALYGRGIYLSSELGVSLPYSRVGYGWGGSILGNELSCIALCELIDHPDVKRGNSGGNRRNTMNTFEGKVPNKYYVVTNNELVRIRYLLVYSKETCTLRNTDSRGLVGWFKRHKLLTFVLGYVVLLASVGLTHNKHVEKYYRLFIQKVGFDE